MLHYGTPRYNESAPEWWTPSYNKTVPCECTPSYNEFQLLTCVDIINNNCYTTECYEPF